MKRAFSKLILFTLSGALAEAKLAPLPSWNAEDAAKLKSGELVVGRALLTKEGLKKKEEPKPVELVIEAVEAKPSLDLDKKLATDSEVTGVHLERYFGQRPETLLVDPQELLSMQERADLTHALKMHSEDSEVPMYVCLFDSGQKVPQEFSPQSFYDERFEGNEEPLVIVYYFLGAPHRAQFLLAGGASVEVPKWQVRELLWNSAYKAKEKSDAFDQFEGFVGQLSMRLFWIEEMIRELSELAPVIEPEVLEKESNPRAEKILGFWETSVKHHLPAVFAWGVGAVCVLLTGCYFIFRRRFYFPESSSSPSRLGASVGGGYGGILSYKDQRVPPSEQKKQFKSDFF